MLKKVVKMFRLKGALLDVNPFTPASAKWHLQDFTLSDTR